MQTIFERLDRLCEELAAQQHIPDDWWRAELASLKEQIADRLVERRAQPDRRRDTSRDVTRDRRQEGAPPTGRVAQDHPFGESAAVAVSARLQSGTAGYPGDVERDDVPKPAERFPITA